MKLKAAFLAIALVTASATSAGSTTTTVVPIPTSVVQDDMTECQLEQYIRCMRSHGDHGFCVDQAMAQVCRR